MQLYNNKKNKRRKQHNNKSKSNERQPSKDQPIRKEKSPKGKVKLITI